MRVVVVGEVDHGKSTLIGRLLYDSGAIPESKLSELQAVAEEYKKKFEFSSFLDAFSEEIKQERTIGTTEILFKGKYLHTLIDVPGHLEFIEAMLTGASHADTTVLVVDVTKGIEEQTSRHLGLVRLLGLKDIIVVVNKMDLVGYDWNTFLAASNTIFGLVGRLGFSNWTIIPISALEGDNIYSTTSKYSGVDIQSLTQTLDLREKFGASKEEPQRFIVQGLYKGQVLGYGSLPLEEVTWWGPTGAPCRGEVGGKKKLEVAKELTVRFFVLAEKIRVGDRLTLRCGTKTVDCVVTHLLGKFSSETGESTGRGPFRKYDIGLATLEVEPIAVSRFKDDPELGRFTLSRRGKVAAVGAVEEYE